MIELRYAFGFIRLDSTLTDLYSERAGPSLFKVQFVELRLLFMARSYGDSAAALNETAMYIGNFWIFPKEKPLVACFGTIALANLGFGIVRGYMSQNGGILDNTI